ncbi:MAG: CAP domain-containing protein [Oscillospiraceae bacterium]|nr:CAP domain-containing protein [Oscillospiraceae bacterium]
MTKKLLMILCMAVMLTACSNADSSTAEVTTPAGQTTTTTTTTTTTATEPTTTTTTEEQSVTTTTTTTQSEQTVTTTTPEEVTTTTTAETTKSKVTTTTKKPTTTTKVTTTTAKKTTTTTTTTTKKVEEPPKDGVVMYSCGITMRKKPKSGASQILIEDIPANEEFIVIGDIIYNDYGEWYYIYYNQMYGYVLANGVNRLPVERCDEEICMRINELRVSLGLNELRVDEELCEMAAQRSVEISQTGQPHIRPDGSSYSSILEEYGWVRGVDFYVAGENVQTGTESARLAYECWRTSEGHYNNMVGNYTAMGLSRKPDGTGSWVLLLVRETKE